MNATTLRFRPILAAMAAATVGLSACSLPIGDESTLGSTSVDPQNGATPGSNLQTQDIVFTSEHIETVGSCDLLLDRIKAEAIDRVGPWGFGGQFGYRRDFTTMEDDEMEGDAMESADSAATNRTSADASAPAVGADDSGGAPPPATATLAPSTTAAPTKEASETNRQEQEVDEADIVKTDGRRLVAVFDRHMNVIDVTGDEPVLAHSIELPDGTWGGEMFLSGDKALLMASGWIEQPLAGDASDVDRSWFGGSPIGRLLEVDLVSGDVGRILEFEGSYLSAREINDTIRIVLSAPADRFAFVHPSSEAAIDGATKANQAIIEDSTIEQWIPTYRIVDQGEEVTSGPIVDCRRVHLPNEFAGFGSVVVLTANLTNGLAIDDSLAVFTEAQTVYASTSRLAVATPRVHDPIPFAAPSELAPPDNDPDYQTTIHTFDITNPNFASYVASGKVRGHLLNQYSLSEFGGYLRVATTDGSPWSPERNSESFVTIFAEDGQELRATGQVGDLGKGEQIFAVRFLGTTAYVVTFRQTDPLYTVDLADPNNPRVLGELKIPGFSSYLHPLSDDLLLGVGTDGDEQGRTGGAVASLFDVSDLSDPQLISKLSLGPGINTRANGHSSTPVSHDARAFTQWQGTSLIPIGWWSYDPTEGREHNGSAVVLVEVARGNELRESGRVTHAEITQCYDHQKQEPYLVDSGASVPRDGDCWSYTPEIQRSVIVGDQLFTLSPAGAKVTRWSDLAPQTWISFPSAEEGF